MAVSTWCLNSKYLLVSSQVDCRLVSSLGWVLDLRAVGPVQYPGQAKTWGLEITEKNVMPLMNVLVFSDKGEDSYALSHNTFTETDSVGHKRTTGHVTNLWW